MRRDNRFFCNIPESGGKEFGIIPAPFLFAIIHKCVCKSAKIDV